MLQSLLSLDSHVLMASQHLIGPEYAMMIQILGELIVLWGAIFLVLLWLYGIYKKDILFKLTALRIFFLIVLVFSIYAIINLGLPQWRPGAMELSGADALIPHPTDNSFPSGHALFSAAMLVGIWKYFRNGWIISITVLFALISTTARVIGGVHYPGDILGGFFFGWIGAVFLARIVENKKFQDTVFPIILRIASWIKL